MQSTVELPVLNYYHPQPEEPERVVRVFQGKKCRVWKATVWGDEYATAHEYSHKSWAATAKSGRGGDWNKGLGNTPDDPKVVERTGFLGEMVYCKGMDDPQGVDLTYREGGDAQDFLFADESLDVKNSKVRYTWDCAWVKAREREGSRLMVPRCKIYVFGFTEREDRDEGWASVVLAGWATKKDLTDRTPVRARPQRWNHFNYEIPFSELKSMDSLRDLRDSLK